MNEFRKAPDGQPTSNIELQLRVAKEEVAEGIRWQTECAKKVVSATRLLEWAQDRQAELEWQLEQRKSGA